MTPSRRFDVLAAELTVTFSLNEIKYKQKFSHTCQHRHGDAELQDLLVVEMVGKTRVQRGRYQSLRVSERHLFGQADDSSFGITPTGRLDIIDGSDLSLGQSR